MDPPNYVPPSTVVPVSNMVSAQVRAATPSILRRGARSRRRRDSEEHKQANICNSEPGTSHERMEDFSILFEGAKTTIFSPIRGSGSSPIKQLPFSPSQFLNSPGMAHITFDVALSSTPVKKHPVTNTKSETPKQQVRYLITFYYRIRK